MKLCSKPQVYGLKETNVNSGRELEVEESLSLIRTSAGNLMGWGGRGQVGPFLLREQINVSSK